MHADDTVKIPLRARDGTVRAYAVVDAADADFVKQWRWHLHPKGYAARCERKGGRRIFLLHRILLGLAHGDLRDGDHIDRDRLNYRRKNLRILPDGKNRHNQSSRENRTSPYRGVSWDKGRRKWRAQVSGRWLGVFSDEVEAAEVAKAARLKILSYAVD